MANQKIPLYIPVFINSATYTPARVLPRLYFYNGQVDCERWYISDGGNSARDQNAFPYFDHYNVSGSQFPTTTSKSLLFNNEAAVYGEVPTNSLYTTYWEKYIEFLYNPKTRVLNCQAIIPLADYFHMELNDIVNFRGNYWHLRAINDYSLKDGTCNLQLVGPVIPDVFDKIVPVPPPPPQASSSVSWSYIEYLQDGTFNVYDNSITLGTLTADGSGNAQVSQSHYVTASLVPVNYPSSGSVTMSLNVNGDTTISNVAYTNTTISASFLVGNSKTYYITGSIRYNDTPPPQLSSSLSWSYDETIQDGTFTIFDNASTITTLTADGIGNTQISQSHYVTASLTPINFPSTGSVTMSLFVNGGGLNISRSTSINETITASFLVGAGQEYYITSSTIFTQLSSSVSWSYSESAQDGTFIVYDNANSIATLTANGNGNSQISQSHYVTASLVPVSYPSSGSVTMSLFVNGAATIATTAYTNTTITASFLVGTGSIYNITGSIQWNPPPIAPVSWSYSESAQDGTFIVYDNASTIATLTANGNGNAQVFTSNYVTASLVPVNYPSSGSVTMSLNVNGSTTASVTSNANETITASFLVTTGSVYSITGSIQWNPTPLAIEYLLVGGGGGGGWFPASSDGGPAAGGGGAGGFVSGTIDLSLANTYPILIGTGGVDVSNIAQNGGNTTAFGLTAYGGGSGGEQSGVGTFKPAGSGSSGGGGSISTDPPISGSAIYGSQGKDGGAGSSYSFGGGGLYSGGGGGGGASVKGETAYGAPGKIIGGAGGDGKAWFDGKYYAGGGGGGSWSTSTTSTTCAIGGIGGGGQGGSKGFGDATPGSVNTGGGGGGGTGSRAGGSGIVKVRYAGSGSKATGGTIEYSGSYTYHTFTASGDFITN